MNPERNLRRTVLPNGLIVLTERMDHLRSVAMGVWIKSGSRCEPAETNGISHFVEHMLFKGTRSRTAQDIARGRRTEIDHLNGLIVRQAEKHGIPVPVNRTLYALVKLIESKPH